MSIYLDYFGLKEFPFSLTPDTSYYFRHSAQQEALNVLLVALRSGEGFVKITGEVGTGKTMLCRKLLDLLDERYVTAYLPNPLLTPRQLHLTLAEDLGLEVPVDASLHDLLTRLNRRLLELAEAGKQVVVLIDECQTMPQQSLEALRLLSNLETEKRKLLQIVLFGQPELNQRLEQPDLRQLRQRIVFSYHLAPLSSDEMDGYLRHRLLVAGYQRGLLVRPPAMRLIYRASQGVPRLVNILSHKALLAAYGQGEKLVGPRQVKAAIRDTEGLPSRQRNWSIPVLIGGFGALAALAGAAVAIWLGG